MHAHPCAYACSLLTHWLSQGQQGNSKPPWAVDHSLPDTGCNNQLCCDPDLAKPARANSCISSTPHQSETFPSFIHSLIHFFVKLSLSVLLRTRQEGKGGKLLPGRVGGTADMELALTVGTGYGPEERQATTRRPQEGGFVFSRTLLAFGDLDGARRALCFDPSLSHMDC